MACDLKQSVDRMTEKLQAIQHLAFQGLGMADERITLGQKYMDLSTAISKISVLVRDNSNVEYYWYAKFVERGVLVQPKVVK